MNVINGRVKVDDMVAYPSQRPNKGLAMRVGRVLELRPDKEAIQVEVVYSTTHIGTPKQQVLAELCVIIDRHHNSSC